MGLSHKFEVGPNPTRPRHGDNLWETGLPLARSLAHVFPATRPMPVHETQKASFLMPRSHQTFRSVVAVKLLGIMLRNR